MREIVLGTAGHVDHGKTSFIRALTGIETDRLKEEKKRGITIELGFAFLDLPCGHRLGIIDVPGHEKFVRNMVAGVGGIDLVAFVVAADEGIMPQTREHFEICSLLGVRRGLIIITKIDMVEPDWLEMVEDDIRDYFKDSFLADAPLFKVSSSTGAGIERVKTGLDEMVAGSEFSEAYGPFRLPVDRIFSMKGFGAVVTGTGISGRIKVPDDICIYPRRRKGRIRGIQVHGQDVIEVEAGRRTAINIQGLETNFVGRGDVLASPDSLQPSYMLDCDFTYLKSNDKPLKNRARVRVHLGTAEIMGRIVLLEQEEAVPGDSLNVQLLLEEPVGTWPGDRYVARSYSPVFTIGGGAVLNPCPGRKRRRFKDVNGEIFAAYGAAPDELAEFHLRESGFSGLTFNDLEVRLGVFGKRLKKILNQPVSARRILVVDSERQWMIHPDTLAMLTGRVLEILAVFHRENALKEGMSKEELRSRLYQGIDNKLFQLALNGLVKSGQIVQEQAVVRLADHVVSLQADAGDMHDEMEALFRDAGLKPPTRREILAHFSGQPEKLVWDIVDVLVRDGRLSRISGDLYFHARSLRVLEDNLREKLAADGEIDAQGFKSLTGLSRKFSIPLLEYFDRQKVTIRVGDKRVLR
ncbi:MAG: selenocysteine-specific translation elongation factor [Deltaproteobacteria bacterium]|nr:selenocysteine-specific translation elongation factor [Deltaproteobacteria bacterium]